jgi:hypothetical protein
MRRTGLGILPLLALWVSGSAFLPLLALWVSGSASLFPLVRQEDEAACGRCRIKERILEIYEAMLVAQKSGVPYQSALNPPPGHAPTSSMA